MGGTVLILGGSGKIGRHAAAAFAAAGWEVRRWTRGTDMAAAAAGADVIVNGLNPPNYHNWAELIPKITAEVIAAARASGASVIVPGNVYVFGDQGGEWSETTPHRPVARKGRIRAEMEAAYRDAGVRTIILRAGNFIDPDHADDIMAQVYLRSIRQGRLTAPGDPDLMQAYCYLPDWARAAVGLAERRATLATFEDVPFPGHAFTLNDLRARIESALGRPVRIVRFPWFFLGLAAPFWELARELREMRYLFDTPHSLSGRRLGELLPGFRPSDPDVVMLATLPPDLRPDQAMGPGGGKHPGR